MKKALLFPLVLAVLLLAAACGDAGRKEDFLAGEVTVYAAPEGAEALENVRVSVAGTPVFVYATKVNAVHAWDGAAPNRRDAGFCYFDFSGKAPVTVHFGESVKRAVLRPLGYGVQPEANEDGSVSFTLTQPGDYVLEPDGDASRALHIFTSLPGEDGPDRDGPSLLYFGPGLHNAANDSRIPSDGIVRLSGGTRVYLAGGAVVQAGFLANGVSDVTVEGRGVIDGSAFDRDAGRGSKLIPLEFNDCKNVTLKDFILSDPAGWCVQYYFVEGGTIENVRMISSRSNGDGISLQSCQDVSVQGCFVRTWDDSLVVKNYPRWSNRQQQGTTRGIRFSKCTLWTDLAQCMEVGYETVGQVMEDISFTDITVLHAYHKPVMSIHNGNNAAIKNVAFTNITVEDAAMGSGDAMGNRQLIDIVVAHNRTWSDQHAVTALGSVDGVRIENVAVLAGRANIPIRIEGSRDTRTGFESDHYVENVTLERVQIGEKMLTASYRYLAKNAYTRGLSVVGGAPATGAELAMPQSEQSLAKYGDEVRVTLR